MTQSSRIQAGLTLVACSVEAVLCTVGIAGLQASYIRCGVHEHLIYAYVPCSSDQFSNLEQPTEVILTTPIWQLRGKGTLMTAPQLRTAHFPSFVMQDADRLGLGIVQIIPHRMHVHLQETVVKHETIDFSSSEPPPRSAAGLSCS